MPSLRRTKLLAVFVWTVVMAGVLNVGAAVSRLKYYRPRTPRAHTNAYVFQQSREPADILFLGTSRTRQGINARLVLNVLRQAGHEGVSAFNVAQPASGMVTTQILLRDMIRSNGCPRIVVLEVSPSSLNQNASWWPTVGDYVAPRDVPLVLRSVKSFDRLDFILFGALRGAMRFYDRFVKPPEPHLVTERLTTLGSLHGDLTWSPESMGPGPSQRAIQRARNHYRRRNWRDLDIGGGTTAALRRCAVLAERCSSGFVLVRMPTLIWYEALDEVGIDVPFLKAIEHLEARYDLRFLDANRANTGIRPGHFSDPVHLNLGGSIVFSEHLSREVLLPELERTR